MWPGFGIESQRSMTNLLGNRSSRRFVTGAVLAAAAYMLLAWVANFRLFLGCGIQSVLETTLFPASILMQGLPFSYESNSFLLVYFALASIPFAIAGGVFASGWKQVPLFTKASLRVCLGFYLLYWVFFSTKTCM
jgi:hypothetical protein